MSNSPIPDSATGTKLSVVHRTTFLYNAPVRESSNTVRLEPRTFPYQRTLSSLIRVVPATRLYRFTDLFENINHHFEISQPHSKLEIESQIKVHNLPLILPEEAYLGGIDIYQAPAVRERTWPYLNDSPRVYRTPEIWRQAVDLTDGIVPVYLQALAIMQWIHTNFRYEPGSTNVKAEVAESFALRRGVCQDFTHIMLGLCRSVNLPARYASGYLYNGPRDKLVGAQASHAWCEVYLPAAGWIGFDPTNNTLADERYVKVAVGRDYEDVAPVEGTYRGTAHCRLEIKVEVEKI